MAGSDLAKSTSRIEPTSVLELKRKWHIVVKEQTSGFVRPRKESVEPQQSDRDDSLRTNQLTLASVPLTLFGRKLPGGTKIAAAMKALMNMYAALQQGREFSNLWAARCRAYSNRQIDEAPLESGLRWTIPAVNLLKIDEKVLYCLTEEVVAEERDRFKQYMGDLPLGFGIISAGPGFGKTSALGVVALGFAHRVKQVYVSAPTPIAVDKFATRLDVLDQRVVARQASLGYYLPLGHESNNSEKLEMLFTVAL
ncbi:hypothetical protein V8C42DRAFT_358789 [Trichoderma barbatum]